MSYTAQRLAREDIQNRLRVDIVPGALLELKMGVSASIDYRFYGLWSKALANVAGTSGTEIAQGYLEQTATPTLIEYMFDHPMYLIVLCAGLFFDPAAALALRPVCQEPQPPAEDRRRACRGARKG